MSMDGNVNTSGTDLTSISMEQELDSYKEKVDHMKMLVKQYSQELQSHKIRKEGVETVSKLLQEGRQEIALLQKKCKTQDTAIRNLQSRLTSNGLSDNITMEEGDIFMPGTSNQLLDNLSRENARLRTLLRGASVNPEEITTLQQALKRKDETISSQTRTCEELQIRVNELEQLMGSSENVKDQTISTLQTTVHKMKEEFQTRDVLCHSLAEETTNLRQQLHDVAVTCQQMALRLERSENASRALEPKVTASNKISEGSDETKEKLIQDNRILQEKVEEVVTMNKRWQEYETQREQHVRYQEAVIRTLQGQLASAQANQLSIARSKMINQALDEAKRRLAFAEEEKRRLETELLERNQTLIEQTTEVERLKNELELSHHGSGTRSDVEILDALKAQIQICTEDFESERRDREKAQSRVSTLEAELQKVRMERDRLAQAAVHRNEPQYNAPYYQNQDFYNNFDVPNNYQNVPHYQNELATRGPQRRFDMLEDNVIDGGVQVDAPPSSVEKKETTSVSTNESTYKSDMTDPLLGGFPVLEDAPLLSTDKDICLDDNEETTCVGGSDVNECHSSRSSSPRRSPRASPRSSKRELLTCPKCRKEFTCDKHGELLEHIELCCD
ncbi:TNFAIP3-interacting protein 2-like [Ylistrum balloti]|uniref:TNFAIP3-interacting protein 2-like n=1 Tax=Ylistrum balloti TaxID=509963 RepID=UPI002905A1E3|nr:TNFAIP3-interacting protein 2-like [Ylistrum balloti]XP_060072952.1 TNFAIP3-interacting protein 2-like [Ylistrum balloti]